MNYTSSQAVYPVLPLKHAVLFPDILMPVAVGRSQSVAAVEAAQASDNQKLIVAAQRDPNKPVSSLDDLYPVGTVAIVTRVLQRQNNVLQVFLHGAERVSLSPAPEGAAYLQAAATPLPTLESESEESIALFRNIRELVGKAVQQMGGVPEEMAPLLMQAENPATLAYLVATMLNLEMEEAVNLLGEESLLALLRQVHQRLAQEVHILELRQ
jgi:ATP-dependent Lon protease